MIIEKRMKVPNGKMLILKAQVKNNHINKVSIEGDFFFHPEDKLVLFEEALVKEGFEDMLHIIVRDENIQLVGVDIESIILLMNQIKLELDTEKREASP